jgi:PhnB protein
MARVSTCLNLPRSTEAGFVFYKAVFGGEFTSPIMRFGMHWMFNCASET